MRESGRLVQGEAAVRLRAQRSEPRVRCGRRARSARPRGFFLGLRCHHAVPHADYGAAPLPLYLHCTLSVAYIPSALCTPASNLPIAIKKTKMTFHLKCHVSAQWFLALGFCCFFFLIYFLSPFDASLLPTFVFVKRKCIVQSSRSKCAAANSSLCVASPRTRVKTLPKTI